MGYSSLCIDQNCDLNCCDSTGHCPSTFEQCRHFLPQTQTTSSPAVSVIYNCSVYINRDVYTQCTSSNAKASSSQSLTPYNKQLIIGFGVSVPCAIIIGVIVYCWCRKKNAAVNEIGMPQQAPILQSQEYNKQQNNLQTNLSDQIISQNAANNYRASQNPQEITYKNLESQFQPNIVNNQQRNPIAQPHNYPVNNNFQVQKPSQPNTPGNVSNSIQGQFVSYQENVIYQENAIHSQRPFNREQSQQPLESQIQLIRGKQVTTSDDSDVSCNSQELENFVNYFFPFLNSEFFEGEFESLEEDPMEFSQNGKMNSINKNSSFAPFYPPHMMPPSRKNEERQKLRQQNKEAGKGLARRK